MPKAKRNPEPVAAPAPPKTKADLLSEAIRSLVAFRDFSKRNRLLEWCDNQAKAIDEIRMALAFDSPEGYRRAAYLIEHLFAERIQRDVACVMVAAVFADKAEGLTDRDPDETIQQLAESIAVRAISDRGRMGTSSDPVHDAARDCQERGRREAYDSISQIVWSYRDQIARAEKGASDER